MQHRVAFTQGLIRIGDQEEGVLVSDTHSPSMNELRGRLGAAERNIRTVLEKVDDLTEVLVKTHSSFDGIALMNAVNAAYKMYHKNTRPDAQLSQDIHMESRLRDVESFANAHKMRVQTILSFYADVKANRNIQAHQPSEFQNEVALKSLEDGGPYSSTPWSKEIAEVVRSLNSSQQ